MHGEEDEVVQLFCRFHAADDLAVLGQLLRSIEQRLKLIAGGRDELLNETLFSTLGEARELLAAWRDDYNRVRPHSALANRTPEEFHDHHLALAVTNDQVQKMSAGLTL